jgi:4-amino-4-deoxy-L-arabinose transferase-like glycosyltransferase
MNVMTAQPEPAIQPQATAASFRPWRAVAMLLLAGLAVRVPIWFAFEGLAERNHDGQHYNRLALRLLETGMYTEASGEPASLRPPLYPAFVAGVYWVFGAENLQAVRAIQAVLGLLIAVATYGLAREVYSPRVGVWAAGLACFYPPLVGFGNLLLTEVLFTLLLTVGCWCLAAAVRRGSLAALGLAGLVLGFATLTRSIVWLFPPVLALYLLAAWRGRPVMRLAAAALPCVVLAMTIAPWSMRTSLIEKTFIAVDSMGGRNFMMGNYEHTPLERSWATISIVQGENEWHRLLARRFPEYRKATQGQRDKLAMRYAVEFIREHPALTLQRSLIKFFNFWQIERTLVAGSAAGLFGPLPMWLVGLLAVMVCGSYVAAIFAGIFGAICRPPADLRLHLLLLLVVCFVCGMHSITFAHSRYAIPVTPIVLVYAAAALASWRTIWAARGGWAFRLAATACLVLVAAWTRELIMVDLQHLGDMVG